MTENAPDRSDQTAEAPADAQAIVDAAIRELLAGLSPSQAAYLASVLTARSAAELHKIAKAQATASKGEADWGTWAALQNGARRLVLDAAPAREAAARLVGRPR